jgi:hypothetical protein
MIYAEVTNAGKQTVILSPDSVQAPDTTESDIITPGFSSHKVQYQVENNQLLKQAIILPGEKKHLVMIFGSPADSRPVHRKSAPGSRGKPVLYPTKRPDQAAPNNVECSFGLYYTVLGGYSERSLLKVNGAGHF